MRASAHHKEWQRNQNGKRTNAVAHGVRDFFPWRLWPIGFQLRGYLCLIQILLKPSEHATDLFWAAKIRDGV